MTRLRGRHDRSRVPTDPPSRFGGRMRGTARLMLIVFWLTGAAGPVAAEPTETALGPAETRYGAGEFTINEPDNTEYTQYTDRAIVDWGIDIQQGPGHTLGFRQQENFVVLNRSPGLRASIFFGTVQCDATCIFANQAGVYFADGSFTDVGQLIAAAGNLSTPDFLSGQYLFSGLQGAVINHGLMRGDSITLIGQQVANFGQIETPGGSFAMLAGNKILLRDLDSPIIIESPIPPVGVSGLAGSPFGDRPAIENAGTIDATNGTVRLAAGDMLSFAIRQTGEIRAQRIALEGGDDGLVEVGGLLDASDSRPGQQGGEIDVLGDYLAIVDDAVLDTSGPAGGGRVRIGGERQGAGETRTARGTYVHPDAQIRADAEDRGDGGEIIVWADDTAQVYGRISAQGGVLGGAGGFVETSGKRFLDVRRAPRVGARSGRAGDPGGDWLIDPNNIEIVASTAICGNAPECLDSGLNDEILQNPSFAETGPILAPTVDDSKITASVIVGALEGGSNVSILTQTISTTQGQQVGDITVSAEIALDEARAPGPGTNVKLSLLASQNIRVNAPIKVNRRPDTAGAPSDLTLEIDFIAGDTNQAQAIAPVDQTPNNFLGEIDVRADIDTAGGRVSLQGFGVRSSPNASIKTNGADLDVRSVVGDITIRGPIDTSTDIVSETTGTALLGGRVTMLSEVIRRPDSGAADTQTRPVGGNIQLTHSIVTGGGNVDLTAKGGDLTLDSTIASQGGGVTLRALRQTLLPITASDVAETVGGRISLGETGRILSSGGFIDLGVADLTTFLPGAQEIILRGELDSRVLDPSVSFLPGMATADLTFDLTKVGGPVLLNTVGDGALVWLRAAVGTEPSIRTNGGRVDSFGDGQFVMEDGEIDARFDPASGPPATPRPDDLGLSSTILLQHAGRVEILAQDTTLLAAEESVTIFAGLAGGVGDLVFAEGTGTAPSASIIADQITLIAGDGEAPGGVGTNARVVLGNTLIQGFTTASPTDFTLQQDADLLTADIIGNLSAHLDALDSLTLSAWDGTITLTEKDLLEADGLALDLNAGKSVEVASGSPPPPAGGNPLASLEISIVESFTLGERLAGWISGAAKALSIRAGTPSNSADPSLTIAGSNDPQNPMPLFASESLTLQGGRRGSGDLAFTGESVLGAPSILLRAGLGDPQGTSRVRTDGLTSVSFSRGDGAAVTDFELRQDTAIDDSVIPSSDRFVDGIDNLRYTLRADALGSGITLGPAGATALKDTDLRLFANGPIDLSGLADAALQVRALQIGGIGSFEYTGIYNDKFSFTPGSLMRSLVIRAGLGGTGVLSFQGGLTIEADDIRLVAGDGVGGGAVGDTPGSSINLTPADGLAAPIFRKDANTGPDQFVFRQDVSIIQSALPTLETHFAGNAPQKLAIRSDDNGITLDDFSSQPVLVASEQIVLSAPIVTLDRSDGADLVIDDVFGDGSSGTPPKLEIRTRDANLRAFDIAGAAPPLGIVLPGSTLRLTAFDGPAASDPIINPPPRFDFDAIIDQAPTTIRLISDGSIGSNNLIALAQLGNGATPAPLNSYFLTSNFGSIEVQPGDIQAGDIILILGGLDQFAGEPPRSVRFRDDDGNAGTGFELSSLTVENPFDWVVQNETASQSLKLTATDFMALVAGLDNKGNLAFAGDVQLESRAIVLQAGDDPLNPVRIAQPSTDPRPVVNTENLTVNLTDPSNNNLDTSLVIIQHGGFSDKTTPLPAGTSRIIDRSKITVDGDANTLLDQMQLSAIFSDIEIDNYGTGTSILPARRLTLVAGSQSEDGGKIRLAQGNGSDLNLSVRADGITEVFEELRLFGRNIELSTVPSDGNLTDTGVIRVRGPNVFLLGPLVGLDAQGNRLFTSPDSVLFEQNAGFRELGGALGCAGRGCLPDAFQLGPSLAANIDYRIDSRAGQIEVNEPLTLEVWGSDLTLSANNTDPDPSQPDVLFDIQTRRTLDFFVNSITVDANAADPRSIILFRADPADTFGDLTLVSALSQTYNSEVRIDGTIELAGDTVEFASTIDEDPAASLSELIVGIVNEGRFGGSIGAAGLDTRLDRLRINFDPTAATAATIRFGPETGSAETLVNADIVQFFALSDTLNDIRVPRAPLASTIYKKNGNLSFDTTTFEMGVGEKMTVQGDLVINALATATIGDLSALKIDVSAPTIQIVRRPAGNYLAQDGSLQPDAGLDFVANTIAFNGNIVLTGVGQLPSFGIADPSSAPNFMDGFAVLGARSSRRALTTADFVWGIQSALPDLHPDGASRDDITSMYFEDDLVPIPQAWDPEAWLPWERSELTNLFVFARPLNRVEYASWLAGSAVIDDVGRDLQKWDGRPLPIAAKRLDGAGAKQAIELFEQIFGADGGNVEYLRKTLQRAVDHYTRNTGARRVVGFELRRYVKNRPSSLYQAYQLLEDLDRLFAYHRGLGLTPGEYRPIQARWLAAIKPDGITTAELAEAVQPSRYVRGSDVLDIFGD